MPLDYIQTLGYVCLAIYYMAKTLSKFPLF